jgi:hypothetical protein
MDPEVWGTSPAGVFDVASPAAIAGFPACPSRVGFSLSRAKLAAATRGRERVNGRVPPSHGFCRNHTAD